MTTEQKEKIRLSNLGKKHIWTEDSLLRFRKVKKGVPSWNKGKKLSKEHREKAKFGRLGKKDSPERIEQKMQRMLGEKNPNYKHGMSKFTVSHYSDLRYKLWREAIFERDNYTCQKCFLVGVYIEPHHIKSWARYPGLRFELSNGLTLCKECHKLTDNYKGRGKKLST